MYPTREQLAVQRMEKRAAVTKALIKALKDAGIKHTSWLVNHHFEPYTAIRLTNTGVSVDVDMDHLSSFSYKMPKVRIKVQTPRRHRPTKQFPERKEGFDYKAITDYISQEIAAEKEAQTWAEKSRIDHENADLAEDLLKQKYKAFMQSSSLYSLFVIDLKPAGSVRVDHSGAMDKFKLEINCLTVEMADKILEILTDKFGEVSNQDDQES